MISVEEIQQIIKSQDKLKLKASEELRFNENINYINFDIVIKAVVKKALILGIKREKKDVIKLIINGGACRGIKVSDYNIIAKKETVVAASPQTPRLLERSKVEFPSDYFTIITVRVTTMPLKEKEFDELKSILILVIKDGVFNSIKLILSQLIYD